MKLTPSSTTRRSVVLARSRSGGSPQMPEPVIRMAPKPSRRTVRSPPISMVPAAAASIALVMVNLPEISPLQSPSPPTLSYGRPVANHRAPASLPFPDRPAGSDSLPGIDHIVVLMKENHSYDNYFGLLDRGDGFTRAPDG